MSILIFLTGALGYGVIETLFRGYTHWTMMLTGGACFLTLYYLNGSIKNTSFLLRAAVGALIITIFEFSVGTMVNLWFGWHVWDYSHLPMNLLGQICPLFTLLWFFLCLSLLVISTGFSYGYQRWRQ